MNSDLAPIDELDRTGITLKNVTPSERRILRGVAQHIGVDWAADGSARIYSRGEVGSVALSPRRIINIRTKVPVRNLLSLASLAYRTAPLPKAAGDTLLDSTESVEDWLTFLLVSELEQMVASGLRSDYVAVRDELPYVRGRIRFEAAARLARPSLTVCEFADFLPDTAENRLLRATLELVATHRVLPGLRPRVARLLTYFGGVSLVRPTSRLVGACRITRLNQHYGAALELCRLLISGSGVDPAVGATSVPAYFFPMAWVFETAITNLLRLRLPDVFRQTGKTYWSTAGTPPTSLTYQADIVVGAPPRLVIDTKYARPEIRNRYGGWSLHNAHFYQVLFYATSLDCPGLLVYPRVDREIDLTFEIEGTSIGLVSLDLQEPGLGSLEEFVSAVRRLSEVAAVA